MRRRFLLGLVLSSFAWPTVAQADLGGDVRELTAARAAGSRVLRLKPRFLQRGERLPLSVPAEMLNPNDSTCTTVSVLGVVGAHFVLRFAEADPGAPSTAFPEASVAGASEVTRCGSGKPLLAGAYLEMRSPRGLIETLVTNSLAPPPRLAEVLPDRDPGSELALGDPGGRPTLPPLADRLQRLAKRAQREAAKGFEQLPTEAGEDGAGAESLTLARGCHQLSLLSEATAPTSVAIDVDAEVVDGETGARLAVDRADDADATLNVCLGVPTRVELRFLGAAPHAALRLTLARWDLPAGLPRSWGSEAHASLARVARSAHLELPNAPVYSSLGVQGSTLLPIEVEPSACYSVLLVPLRGEARTLSLSVRAHAIGEVAHGAADSDGTATSFCAQGARLATIDVDSQGSGLAWLLAIWQTGQSSLGVVFR